MKNIIVFNDTNHNIIEITKGSIGSQYPSLIGALCDFLKSYHHAEYVKHEYETFSNKLIIVGKVDGKLIRSELNPEDITYINKDLSENNLATEKSPMTR